MNRLEHLIEILGEECGETAQRASKSNRFGLTEIQPGQEYTNAERMIHEFNDIIAAMEMLQAEGVIGDFYNRERIEAKKIQVEKFLLHSKKCGTLTE